MKKYLFGWGVALCLAGASCWGAPVARAARTARVDTQGVLRWTDDGTEVAVFGVNYYAPFTVDYQHIRAKGLDFDQVMRADVAHFRRLGLTSIRIHCFDRQFSTHEGGFRANHHIELLDKLIDLCAQNGIYTILTPIAWWGGSYAEDKEGFSNDWPMKQMTGDRRSWPIQARFLKEFGEHRNTVTGRRYADDPAILCFELINEPLYPENHPDADVTDYVNALADGLRASGTTKPIFYNSWQGRNAAVGRARVDGVTGSYYPTGLVAGHTLRGSQMARIVASSLHPDDALAHKAKMIYEFDCADTPGAYMYPALAKLFRHEGVQAANQFQYDPLCLADVNQGWMTHHLSLVYTPAKALSFGIAAEVFRRLPRGCDYTPAAQTMDFAPFRLDAARNLAQLVTETDYLYTADPLDPPPAPDKLTRIWGVGTSCVAGASGNGAYFLDKAAPGLWRLQLYPDVFNTADEYSGGPSVKQVLLPGPRALRLALGDLGPSYRVRAAASGEVCTQAQDGRVLLAPGDYVVENLPAFDAAVQAALAALDTPAYAAREPSYATHLAADPPRQWGTTQPLPLEIRAAKTQKLTAHVRLTATDEHGREINLPSATTTYTIPLRNSPEEWEFFDPDEARAHVSWGGPAISFSDAVDPDRGKALRVAAKPGAFAEGGKEYVGGTVTCDYNAFQALFGPVGPAKEVVFRARATDPFTKKIECVFTQVDGGNWGVDLPLTTEWRTIRVPVKDLRPYWGTRRDGPTKPDPAQAQSFRFGYGRWLYRDTLDQPHGFELSSVKLSF